jgi:putative transposase
MDDRRATSVVRRRRWSDEEKGRIALIISAWRVLTKQNIAISMDGKAWRDNVFVERLWRTIKYEEVYLRAYESVSNARASIGRYLRFYKHTSQHPSVYMIEEKRLC